MQRKLGRSGLGVVGKHMGMEMGSSPGVFGGSCYLLTESKGSCLKGSQSLSVLNAGARGLVTPGVRACACNVGSGDSKNVDVGIVITLGIL